MIDIVTGVLGAILALFSGLLGIWLATDRRAGADDYVRAAALGLFAAIFGVASITAFTRAF